MWNFSIGREKKSRLCKIVKLVTIKGSGCGRGLKLNIGLLSHDLDDAKNFVGELCLSTTKESLCTYFSSFEETVDCVFMENNDTGKSKSLDLWNLRN